MGKKKVQKDSLLGAPAGASQQQPSAMNHHELQVRDDMKFSVWPSFADPKAMNPMMKQFFEKKGLFEAKQN